MFLSAMEKTDQERALVTIDSGHFFSGACFNSGGTSTQESLILFTFSSLNTETLRSIYSEGTGLKAMRKLKMANRRPTAKERLRKIYVF